ncbi:hypothetical protein N801_18925 [Knoellia aerolata DSM 18566]|uniref:Uncharacterized protein n=1 Tax=Knoellia aerolata DSM 18566 TaxID=1385519 RepID=A0A0A0JUN6_9MICO|nr:hypothetical protein N801_18925 [Knoellia aerolata DSM 18566]
MTQEIVEALLPFTELLRTKCQSLDLLNCPHLAIGGDSCAHVNKPESSGRAICNFFQLVLTQHQGNVLGEIRPRAPAGGVDD